MNDICTPIRERFSFYLDGDVNGLEMQQIGAHLDTCPSCRTEFAEWKSMQRALMAARSAPLPENLAVRLRVALSHERSDAQRTFVQRFVDRWELYRDNTLRPFGVQAAVAVAAVVLLVFSFSLLGAVAAPSSVEANDTPLTGFSAPRYMYSVQGSAADIEVSPDRPLLVEAQVNAQGRVYEYRVISGPSDVDTESRLRNQMVHAVFEPAHVFGFPVPGRVLLTYAGISVHA